METTGLLPVNPIEEEIELCISKSNNGSRDVSSTNSSDYAPSSSADHLIVMVHGMNGSEKEWMFASEQFAKGFPDKVFVHCSKRNALTLTRDGVDVMGERLAEEVIEVIRRKPDMRKISFIAHSVGGLVARYAIGKLYKTPENELNSSNTESKVDSVGTIYGLVAMNFITIATPHLGSSGHKQVPLLFGISALEKIARFLAPCLVGKTGRHLFLTDGVEGKNPLLMCMLKDSHKCYFMSALRSFESRVVYANVTHDYIVGWRTSSIRGDNVLRKEGALNGKYAHIVYEEDCQACDLVEDISCDSIQEELVRGLSCVSWQKVDVSFQTSRIKHEAHSLIQVKDQLKHIEGADVIRHMIDNFRT